MSAVARTIVGLSGGVDSSVAALLLQRAGEPIAGLFMHNWNDDGSGECRAEEDRRDAVAVAGRLGIPVHFRDFSAEYWDGVFRHFIAEYAAGRTPNPDVLCNREVKFKHMLDAALALGAERIATGHYARVDSHTGTYRLLRAADRAKDQSYFLHQLGQAQLARTLFPLGDIARKQDVRDLAREAGLPTAAKKDSTGICFIGERDFRSFLSHYLPMQPGDIVDTQGRVLGTHPGVFFFTLGQRGGLGLGGVAGARAEPWYVVGKDVPRNVLVVDQGDSPWLLSRTLTSEPMHWIAGAAPVRALRCTAQVRYRQDDQACDVQVRDDGTLHVAFDAPQRAVAPGQSVVLYDGAVCLGGAVIASSDAPALH